MNRSLGDSGEELAEKYLLWKGYHTLHKNYRIGKIEVDLIVSKINTIVFVEVKARRDIGYGKPFEAVTPAKQQRLRKAAELYIASNSKNDNSYRFDVVSITFGEDESQVNIEHIENAF